MDRAPCWSFVLVLLTASALAQDSRPASWPTSRPAASRKIIDSEREADERFLAGAEIQSRIKKLEAGVWVAIWGAAHFESDADLTKLLARIDVASRAAEHRFVFAVGSEGERRLGAIWHGLECAGDDFAARLGGIGGFGYVGAPRGHWTAITEKGTVYLRSSPSLDNHIGFLTIPVRIVPPGEGGQAERLWFGSSNTFNGGLLLPEGLCWPRFEIPGLARVRCDGGQEPALEYRFRRFLLHLSVPELGVDVVDEALGDSIVDGPPSPAVTLFGRTWRPLDFELRRRAAGEKKPILVLDRGNQTDLGVIERLMTDEVRSLLDQWIPALPSVHDTLGTQVWRPANSADLESAEFEFRPCLYSYYPAPIDGKETLPWLVSGEIYYLTPKATAAGLAAFLRAAAVKRPKPYERP